ncbi:MULTISPECIES: hypothetical protein [Vibrio]|uniref:hypothetical protein n=1 Tax=Vibrio TaxID=662 RepID=UPI000893B2A9|nr:MULTISPECIES: hypothetical protein [Vibrio]OFJ25192.1 hypothetical protein BFX31_14560 [Vibrio paracholerae]TXX46432.1 hypothetical protein FXF14_14905 [Vibrio cholerae]TYA08216.1 hypothetical protein FXE34_08510 [Vibrio cholerae]WOQ99230.1 hypothetical protein R4537_01550 [Vibrio paracholerae]
MKNINIIKGDFSGEIWQLEKDLIKTGFYKIKHIPFSEITELKKLEVTKKEHFVEFSLADGKSFISTMSQKTYDSCYKSFIEFGNQPKNLELPLVNKSKSNVILAGFGILFLAVILRGEPEKQLVTSEKVTLCKAYIGEMFGKPVSIIDNYKNSDGLIYVRYVRASDKTSWSYVCDVSGGRMVWAGWMNDTQNWGRWRFEDEVKLNYDNNSKKMVFMMPDTGNRVEVKL